jgi:hypothetical protein
LERIEKPWCHKTLFAATEEYIGKILLVKKATDKVRNIRNRKTRPSVA